MSKKFLAAVLAVLCIASLIAASGASATESEDTRPPELVGLSISPAEVDVTGASQKVTLTAHIKDDLSGVGYADAILYGPGRAEESGAFMTRIEGDANDGIYQGTATIQRFSQAGEWTVGDFALEDMVGNRRLIQAVELEELGLPSSVRVKSTSDTTPPELVSLSIEPAEVDVTGASQKVTLTAHIKDDLSGVRYANADLYSPTGTEEQGAFLTRVEGDANDGFYRGTATIQRFSEAGEWTVRELALEDAVGNHELINAGQLKELGAAYSLQVNGTPDTRPPELVGLSISPAEVDVTGASQKVTLTAHIKDDLSGVGYADAILYGPGRAEESGAFMTRIEGDANDGIYQGTATIQRFSQAGEWTVGDFALEDMVGNRRLIQAVELEELGLPSSVRVKEDELVEEEPPAESAPPQLTELSSEPSEIDVTKEAASVKVLAHIKSESGFTGGYVDFHAPGSETNALEFFERVSGTEFDGEYEAKVLFPKGSEAGTWHAEVDLGDRAGHEIRIGPEGLAERGLPSSVFVVDKAEEPVEEPGEGPVLEADELIFEPSEIDTAETKVPVEVFAHIVSEAGFAGGHVEFHSPSGEGTALVSLELEAGDEFNGGYRGVATFPQGSEPGNWLAELVISDDAGRKLILGPEQLNERGLPYEVTVVNPVLPPVVTGISPSSGPESGGTPVHLIGSGFENATAVEFGEHLAEFVYESPESITAYASPGTGNVGVAVVTPAGISGEVNYHYEPSVAIALSSSPNPSVHGQKVTFTAMIEAGVKGGPTPIGTVAFREGTTTLGVVNLSKGKATLNTTTLGAGEHPVVAEYSGDSHYGSAVSAPVTQVVAKASTELTLTSSLNPAPFGSSGTLKAHVAALAPGAGTPAGTVTFREGETALSTVQLAGGNASLSLKSLPTGEHPITAVYSGDANDKASEAGPVKQVITKASTELALTSTLNPAPFGSSATLKATVKAVTPGGGTPAGTVTFREGETVLATVPLSAGSAKYALKTTAPGEHEITAIYSGEADYEASSGGIVQAIVVASTELTLTSSKNPAPHGSSGTLKATVKTIAPGGGIPAGTVTFREGETVLAIIPLSSGAATYPLKALTLGEHKITATYSGNADYGTSESTIGQVITP